MPSLAAAFALAGFLLISARAALTVDTYWDTLAYHWPFAARIAGLCDRHCFLMPPGIEERYDGFPKLWHALQGLLWKVTGTPAFADLLGVAAVGTLCVYLRRRFAVPLAWSWLALIAIPVVQIQLTASYNDLPLNIAVTLALMVILRMIAEPLADQRLDIVVALLALGVAAGSKFQLVPIGLVAWGTIVTLAAARPASVGFRRRATTIVVLGIAGAVVLLPIPVLNAYAFHNPFYPIAVSLGPFHLPGPEDIPQVGAIADAWVPWPSPLRWLVSVLEFDAYRGRPLPWTVDQGDLPPGNPSFRMGGYFVTYAIGSLALLWWSARTAPKRGWIIALVLSITVVCATMPHSHALRYYMFWMLTLVSMTLALAHSPLFARAAQGIQRSVMHGLVAVAAASVILMTGGSYLQTDGPVLQDLIAETEPVIANVADGGILCILNRHPRAFLYSQLFHPSRHYQTRSLWSDEPAECTTRLELKQ